MTKAEFRIRVSELGSVTGKSGANNYNIQRVTEDRVYFIRGGKTDKESINLDELYHYYLNASTYTTTEAKEYISGRIQSPSVAILLALKE